jgi:Pentapeptide repeats (8 copies)
LAGSRDVRTGVLGFLLRLVAQISLVLAPIALLVFFELQFLPYHDEKITWWHRIAVAADIVLLWMLWPSIARGETAGLSWRDLRRGKIVALAFASLLPVLLVTTIATFPGEWLEDNLWKDGMDKPWRLASMHKLLVAGDVDFAARKPTSFWSNRLVLPGFDAIDHTKFDSEAKIAAVSETISLRARDLEGAVLIGAKLRKADFTAVQLQGAQLGDADLRGAKFECSNPQRAQQCAQLQGASRVHAQLQGASLDEAELQDASLFGAGLQGASLDAAELQGASLDEAQLQGASFVAVFAWRTTARNAVWEDTRVDNPVTGPKYECVEASAIYIPGIHVQGAQVVCNWSHKPFNNLKRMITEQVPEGVLRHTAMESIEQRLDPDPTKAPEGEYEATVWEAQASASPVP